MVAFRIMWRSRRRTFFTACGAAMLAAAAVLVWQGIRFTLLLEHQASLVFEDSAAREARAFLGDLEEAVHRVEEAALQALRDSPPNPSWKAMETIKSSHPIIQGSFLLGTDRNLVYPPHPGPVLPDLAHEEFPPEEYLRARRIALNSSLREEAIAALTAIASAPEVAGPWRLRAQAGVAAVHLQAGRPMQAAQVYASISTDFPEELREITRPSREQLVLAQALATHAAGDVEPARALLLEELRKLERGGPLKMGSDDAALLIRKASLLTPLNGESPDSLGFSSQLERFQALNAAAACSLRFARNVQGWIVPRLTKGDRPERFAEDLGEGRCVIAWSQGPPERSLSAVGFLLKPEAVASVLESALRDAAEANADSGGFGGKGGDRSQLPFQVKRAPLPGEFKELAALPGPLAGFHLGLEGEAWLRFLGEARRPFRIALVLIAALGVFLALSAILGLSAIRREMFLARMKTEFAANVSHELKTPLALIRLFGETLYLNRVQDPTKARKYCGIIVRESERLTHLVNNILDFASLEAGRKTFELRPCNLAQVVEETLASYRFQLEERGFQIGLSVPEHLPMTQADPDALAQALINLINNAVKYSPGEKKIDVRVERTEGAIRISVSDRGMGIAPAERRRIFEDFYRSREARRLGTRGSGLGLTLVRRILDAHGGSIELSSILGKGSTFTMVFPLQSAGEEINEESHEPRPKGA